MAINLATEYKTKLAKHFTTGSKTDLWAGKAYDFVGVKGIQVYSLPNISAGTYNRNGDATTGGFRFGKYTEVEDEIQTLVMEHDLTLAKSIDKANASEQYNIKRASEVLQMFNARTVRPTIDKYRLNAWATGHGLSAGKAIQDNGAAAALTANNVLNAIFDGSAALSDKLVPADNRVIYIREKDYVKVKLANNVLGGAQLNAEAVRKGYRGTIDGMAVVTVPQDYLPADVGLLIKYKGATVDPVKLSLLRVQKEPLGIAGDALEGLFLYDAFVLDAMCDGVYVHKIA
jgi:hypothetical protein